MNLREAKELLEENWYILEEGIFDSIKNKFFKKKEDTTEVKPVNKKLYNDQIEKTSQQAYNHTIDSMKDCKIIVALTTYKGRIYNPKFPVCLRSIINQKTKIPFKVVLVLSTEEFKNKTKFPKIYV